VRSAFDVLSCGSELRRGAWSVGFVGIWTVGFVGILGQRRCEMESFHDDCL